MIKLARSLILCAAMLGALPASADQILPPGRVTGNTGNGDILFGALKFGKRQGGKTILQPDSMEILGSGSTGDVSGMAVTAGSGLLSRSLADRWGEIRNVRDFGAACTGLGTDTTGLQAAINAASANRFALRVNGVCRTAPLTVPSNVYIFTDEGAKLVGLSSTDSVIKVVSDADNVTIRGLTIDATALLSAPAGSRIGAISQAPGSGGGRVTIEGNRFVDTYSATVFTSAIMLNGSVSFVRNNYIEGTGGDALNFNFGFNHVEGNFVGRSGDGCVAFNNGARGVISGNTLQKCVLGVGSGPVGNSADPDQKQSLIVVGNTIEACEYGINMGWFAYSGRAAPVNWSIANNVFRNNKRFAINYDGHDAGFAANGTITGNAIWRTGASDFDGAQVAAPVDIRLVNAGGVIVSANTFRDSIGSGRATAIFAQGSPNIAVTGNNIVQSGANQYDTGIFIYDTQKSVVASNIINGALNGIKLEQSSPFDYEASVTGNNLLTILYAGISVGGSGGTFNINGNSMISVGPGTPTAGIVLGVGHNDFSIQNNLIRWASGVAVSNPAGKTWARYQIDGNNTGGGTTP